jgi:hypothetical protein
MLCVKIDVNKHILNFLSLFLIFPGWVKNLFFSFHDIKLNKFCCFSCKTSRVEHTIRNLPEDSYRCTLMIMTILWSYDECCLYMSDCVLNSHIQDLHTFSIRERHFCHRAIVDYDKPVIKIKHKYSCVCVCVYIYM